MSVYSARQRVASARKELEEARKKQASEERKAADLDNQAAAKERSVGSTSSAGLKASYARDATKKRGEAAAARSRAARHGEDAAKAQKKVHDTEAKLRDEEAKVAKREAAERQAAEKKAQKDSERADRTRDAAHQRNVAELQARLDEQEQQLASTPWARTPETITVLFITSSPEDQETLRIDREMREIQQKVRMAEHREALRFEFAVAAQPADLLQRLNEAKPHIVHFSGHSGAAGLVMEDSDGRTRVLRPADLATLLSVSSERIRLAIFNSCVSAEHAADAVTHLDAAIGMEASIGDEAAKVFAGQLYSSIAFGLPVGKAFEQAMLQVRLVFDEGAGEPQLHAAPGIDVDELVLVRPAGD